MNSSSLNKVASEFFATNAPDPLHWTQNSCFAAFRTVSLLHDSRRKSCLNSAIGPKTHILGHFGPFRYCTKVDAKLAELVPLTQSSLNKVASEFFATNALDQLHWTQNSCFGVFRPFRCSTIVDAKLAQIAPLTHKLAK
jgi:hypothetical protein